MARFVDKNLNKNSTRRQQINKQITINLCIQALLPLSLNIIGILITAAISLFNFDSPNLMLAQMCFIILSHWLPVLNPLVPMVCVRDYRNAYTECNQPQQKTKHSSTTTTNCDDCPRK
ncbi:hypothetical protein niasHS_011541 [Heterodera schachtii]|uniref:G protein-coupled receptor n=1 Tax=Heterodera schachtii TaxID=97005 RepID=A0ABD2IV57_HETSC